MTAGIPWFYDDNVCPSPTLPLTAREDALFKMIHRLRLTVENAQNHGKFPIPLSGPKAPRLPLLLDETIELFPEFLEFEWLCNALGLHLQDIREPGLFRRPKLMEDHGVQANEHLQPLYHAEAHLPLSALGRTPYSFLAEVIPTAPVSPSSSVRVEPDSDSPFVLSPPRSSSPLPDIIDFSSDSDSEIKVRNVKVQTDDTPVVQEPGSAEQYGFGGNLFGNVRGDVQEGQTVERGTSPDTDWGQEYGYESDASFSNPAGQAGLPVIHTTVQDGLRITYLEQEWYTVLVGRYPGYYHGISSVLDAIIGCPVSSVQRHPDLYAAQLAYDTAKKEGRVMKVSVLS